MKNYITSFFLLLLFISVTAQEKYCSKKTNSNFFPAGAQARSSSVNTQISHETKYDVRFVHLNLKVNRYNKYIAGNVKTVATVTASSLDTFMTLLHQGLIVDSVKINNAMLSFIRQDSMVKVKIPTALTGSSSFTAIVYYKGTPPVGGSAIGSGFSNAASPSWGNRATWSLSESFVAYHWWPCKQMLTDKIDSSWVYITTDSTNKAGSNGVLTNVVVVDSLKRFEWKSHKPIDYYLISVAVAKYKEYRLYAKPQYLPNDSILIQNYIYDAALNSPNFATQKAALDQMPQVLSFLSNMYGMYPFYKEKYGHCMAPLGGGMEHQTMTTLGFFDYYIDAHELGHQWWGDNVTCKTWGDIWINEGFASYTEHLVAEYLDPVNFAVNLNDAHTNVMAQPGGSIFFTGSDTLNSNRIFSSRLTYDKGGAIIHTLRFLTNNDSLWFKTLRGFQNTYKNSTASAADFKNYYQAQTGINATQFFNQWYYGEGYPTFTVKYNQVGNLCIIKSTETVSMPNVTPLFMTPVQYLIKRTGKPDTTIRVVQNQAVENYTLALTGTITSMICDPNNWIINKANGPTKDATLLPDNLDGLIEPGTNFSGVMLSPNPTSGAFAILNPDNLKGTVEVYSLNGKYLEHKKLEPKTPFDLGRYPGGIYIVRIYDENGVEQKSHKIIRQ